MASLLIPDDVGFTMEGEGDDLAKDVVGDDGAPAEVEEVEEVWREPEEAALVGVSSDPRLTETDLTGLDDELLLGVVDGVISGRSGLSGRSRVPWSTSDLASPGGIGNAEDVESL